jgi:hypothetical protein
MLPNMRRIGQVQTPDANVTCVVASKGFQSSSTIEEHVVVANQERLVVTADHLLATGNIVFSAS